MRTLILVLFAALLAAPVMPAMADPPPWAGKGREHWERDRQRGWEHEARWREREQYRRPPPGHYGGYRPYAYGAPLPQPGVSVFIPIR